MTARTQSKPRARRSAAKPHRGKPFYSQWTWKRLRNDWAAWACVAVLAACVAAFPFIVDVPAALADLRDGVSRTFGLGLFVVAGWAAGIAWAIHTRAWRQGSLFWQRAFGFLALGLFLWGALGLNEADWSSGSVSFKQVSLGGDIGRGFVSGVLGKLVWVSVFVIAAATLAPRPTMWLARNGPRGVEIAWERRWPHRAMQRARTIAGSIVQRPAQRSELSDEVIIGGPGTVYRRRARTAPIGSAPFDPPAPVSPETAVEAQPEPNVPDLELEAEAAEPEQLGFDLPGAHSKWQYPALDLLQAPMPAIHRKHDNAARAQLIVDTLSSFGVDASVVEVNEGPTVTQFGVEPGWEVRYKDLQLRDETGRTQLGTDGRPLTERIEQSRTRVRVNRITALQNDLALALAAPSLRIEAPVPGRAIVGIEVPNDSATVVTLRSVMETKEFTESLRKSKITVALGRGVSGVPVVADLAKMPHLLIAGATGSGKSVCINAIISGIMMNASPDEVRFVMVDPKRVELTPYSPIPHLAFSEVIVDVEKVVGALQAVVAEMEARYKKFAAMAVRNIESYNKHPKILKKLPYWVVIIDELADLMMAAPVEVEKLICRLAQLARATGIHLVVATQRPSVDVITGLIKANFPTRIAFAVTSMTDSRTILDTGGAEKLLGRGDMLYMPTDASKPVRIQGVYLSDGEVERLVQFWTHERFAELAPERADDLLERALIERNGGDPDFDLDENDPLMVRARVLALQHQRVSPGLFQRRLQVGYVKAAKLIERLEDEGLVGAREEGESRPVFQPDHSARHVPDLLD